MRLLFHRSMLYSSVLRVNRIPFIGLFFGMKSTVIITHGRNDDRVPLHYWPSSEDWKYLDSNEMQHFQFTHRSS